jgi:heat-inducible transcriptional repressor
LNGLPVPSKKIAEFPEMQVSSATIRNVVSELEMNGYVTRPHSSAVSIPARKAYRLYVEALGSVNEMMLSSKLRKKVRQQLLQSVSNDINTWGSTAVNVLSNLVGSLAIVTVPQSFQYILSKFTF